MKKYVELPMQYIVGKNQVTYAYREYGDLNGRPLILLHHLSATLDNWDPGLLDLLAVDNHIIVFDNTGVGKTTGKVPVTITEMARDVLYFADALRLQKFDLLGLSMGGFIAQEVLLLAPKRVEHLVLAGTGPHGGKGIKKVGFLTNYDLLRAMFMRKDVKEFLFFTRTDNGKKAAKRYFERINTRRENFDDEIKIGAYLRQLRAIKRFGKADPVDFSNFETPVLVVNGDHDRMVPTTNTYRLHEIFPNSELLIYDDAGHMSIFQEQQDFADKLTKFLRS